MRGVAMTTQSLEESEYRRRVAALRGALPAVPLGARELAQLARNQECDRLLAYRAARLDPAAVVRSVFGEDVRDEGSQLALATGITFERVLLRDTGAALFAMFRRAGRLAEADAVIVDVEGMAPGTDPESLATREAITRDLLSRKLAGELEAPAILWHARLTLEVDGITIAVEPDLMTAAASEAFYRPGEGK